jgi:hypothetical protein
MLPCDVMGAHCPAVHGRSLKRRQQCRGHVGRQDAVERVLEDTKSVPRGAAAARLA